MALLVLPLYIPVLIFGVAAVEGEIMGLGGSAPLLILGAMLLTALALDAVRRRRGAAPGAGVARPHLAVLARRNSDRVRPCASSCSGTG